MKKAVDDRCQDLAFVFLCDGDTPTPTDEDVDELAACIQQAIEDWMGSKGR